MSKTKLQLVIDEFNKFKQIKIGDLISEIEDIYYYGGITESGTSTLRIYVKDLLNAHLIKRLGKGWYIINSELDGEIPYMTGKELKYLKKFNDLDLVLRYLKTKEIRNKVNNNN